MKPTFKSLSTLLLAFLVASFAFASNPKKKFRKNLPRKAVPVSMKMVVGGIGAYADEKWKKNHFNPNGMFQIGAQIFTKDNKVYGTQGIAKGRLDWDNFQIEVVGGAFHDAFLNHSKISIFEPDQVPNHRVLVRLTYQGRQEFSQEIEIPLNFNYSYQLSGNGYSGGDGWEACKDAPSGRKGRSHEKCDGQNGNNGRQGVNGEDGGIGANGPTMEVSLYPFDDLNSDDMVIEAHIKNRRTGKVSKKWFNPRTSTLKVSSNGGSGGDGGDGQDGGNGGNGGDGGREASEDATEIKAYGGHGGNGGHGGWGGYGGPGGNGGQVIINYHPDVAPFLGQILVESKGGRGGCGGRAGSAGKAGCGGDGTKGDGDNGYRGRKGDCGQSGPRGYNGPDAVFFEL